MDELLELLHGRNDAMPLDRAALALASIEYPGLDPQPFLCLLDSHAAELGRRVPAGSDGPAFVNAANAYLFSELGFAGNTANYYDAANSCLNQVLTTRTGIPITLSLVYMEIGRRLGRRIHGIGLPGHFLVRYEDDAYSTYLDPFHGGQSLEARECFELASKATGRAVEPDSALLAPVTKRHILVRMLSNLRAVYLMRQSYRKALTVLSLLIAAPTDGTEEFEREARNLKRYLASLN